MGGKINCLRVILVSQSRAIKIIYSLANVTEWELIVDNLALSLPRGARLGIKPQEQQLSPIINKP
jgi:hypothetical protein